jgi:hypothetical protein
MYKYVKKINFKIIQKFSFLLPKDKCNVVVLLEKRRTLCDEQAQSTVLVIKLQEHYNRTLLAARYTFKGIVRPDWIDLKMVPLNRIGLTGLGY